MVNWRAFVGMVIKFRIKKTGNSLTRLITTNFSKVLYIGVSYIFFLG